MSVEGKQGLVLRGNMVSVEGKTNTHVFLGVY